MKFSFFCLAVLGAALMLGAADASPVKNADFSDWSNGKPVGWGLRSGKNASCALGDGGVLKLENAVIYQRKLDFQPGTAYTVSYEARGEGDAKLMVAVEWNLVSDGKRNGGFTHGGKLLKTGAEWKKHSYRFTYSLRNAADPYIVLRANGTAYLRNLTITGGKKITALGGTWVLNGASKANESGAITVPGRSSAVLSGVPMVRGKRYELSVEAVGIGASEQSSGYHQFRLNANFAGLSSQQVVKSEMLEVFSASPQRKTVFFTVPDEAAFNGTGSLTFSVLGKSNIRFSNLRLAEAVVPQKAKYRIELTSPSFRNTIYASLPADSIRGRIPVDSEIESAVLTFDGRQAALERKGGALVFDIPAAGLAEGSYKLSAELTDTKGRVVTREAVVRKLAPAPHEVVCDNERIYVDGKPFFPVAMYYVWGEKSMKYLASHGFNTGIATFHFPSEEKFLAVLDRAAANGMKMLLTIDLPSPNKPDSEYERWHACAQKALTKKVVEHPALLGWYLADEPAWCGISKEKLTRAYEKFAELDPYHPCFICEAPRGTLEVHERSAAASDIYGVDVYPIPYEKGVNDHRPDSISRFTSLAKRAGGEKKPVLMVLQGFSLLDMTHRPNPIYPERGDLRHAVLSSLVRGARGVAFYGHNHVYRPDFYETFFAAADDMNRILPFFTDDGTCEPLKSAVSGIELYRLRRGGSEAYLALNLGDKKVSAELELPGAADAEYTVPFEGRSVRVDNGKLRDEFAVGEAHLYTASALPEPYITTVDSGAENPYPANAAKRAAKRAAGNKK